MAVMNYKVVTCIDESILKENGLRLLEQFKNNWQPNIEFHCYYFNLDISNYSLPESNNIKYHSLDLNDDYKKFIEDGWQSLSCDPKYGGQGMPKTVSAFFDEMLSSSSLAFKLYTELSIGAYNCIHRHASDSIKDKFLPKIVEGKWSGTMCLTEPVCGTDLGLLKTKAVEQSDGTFKLNMK